MYIFLLNLLNFKIETTLHNPLLKKTLSCGTVYKFVCKSLKAALYLFNSCFKVVWDTVDMSTLYSKTRLKRSPRDG